MTNEEKLRILHMWGYAVVNKSIPVGHASYAGLKKGGGLQFISVKNTGTKEEMTTNTINDVYQQIRKYTYQAFR